VSSWAEALHDYMGWNRSEAKLRVLITGGAGFIGSHLADLHLARGDNVYVVDDLSTGTNANLDHHAGNPNFKLAEADVTEWSELSDALEWADQVYHLAARVGVQRVIADPLRTLDVNIGSTRRVLETAANAKWRPQVLIASSSEVYGFTGAESLKEDGDLVFHSHDQNRWSYALAKLADEFYASAFANQTGLPVTCARLFNTIGPRQSGAYGMVIPRFVEQAVAGVAITVFGDGHQTRSFCDVRDTARALSALAGASVAPGTIVNVGNDHEMRITDVAHMVKTLAHSTSPIEFTSYEAAYGQDFTDIRRRKPDLAKLRELTGFEPAWTLERSITDLIAQEQKRLGIDAEWQQENKQAG
jgi:UDP-glucose 4-epimerase